MTRLDNALADVWQETSSAPADLEFNVAVLERIARHRARSEIGVAAVIALAVWASALLLAPSVSTVVAQLGQGLAGAPVLLSFSISAGVLAVLWLTRRQFRLSLQVFRSMPFMRGGRS